ncbi:GntR family transcriptional regulator [Halomonas urumqiensis]|uniref:GntR family transcriptional regulator n=1 Tax=Halomonas urumqiensis TaxID=1684789 RepID=A0A2N7UHA6_9GAMM|nr:GntR family transcriptional regulator [Halomonas urumqiensis]PMR79814.1 GntR family transcriptional regulator [Halomonas urumqiensis]PTB02158.1 GntR family transcriptional regulator [Halomonas urumqiensis]GHE21615.1 transcriptional regulator [Halomonas urumqiensis]
MSKTWKEDVQAAIRAGERISDQHIVDKVRHAVLTQRLPPGTRLPEVTLGEIFGVSRSVVRKALTRLTANHVIDQRPNQVARVRSPSIDETLETFAARRLVEGEVVALLAGHLDEEQRQALEALSRLEVDAHQRGDEPARIEHSLAIHHRLAELSPNRVLGAMLTDLILRTSIVIALYKRPSLASCFLEGDHPRLLECLRDAEPEAARQVIGDHLQALENLLDLGPREAEADLMAILGQSRAMGA